jgi:preprotein translocase subunit SecG
MQWLLNLVLAVQLLSALVMIGLVLIQHGKGADMGASFGSGASGSLFGATGSANFLSRSTAVCAALFFVATLTLAYFSNDRGQPGAASESVLDRAATSAPAASAAASVPAQIPAGVAPAAAPVAPATTPPAAPAASGPATIPTR